MKRLGAAFVIALAVPLSMAGSATADAPIPAQCKNIGNGNLCIELDSPYSPGWYQKIHGGTVCGTLYMIGGGSFQNIGDFCWSAGQTHTGHGYTGSAGGCWHTRLRVDRPGGGYDEYDSPLACR
ncbi:hypothetical protein [Kibdelosporangium philippinense]|uniref:hypothetical protein n=1 Tax=Kibdelosporangium philippinense TaxID=211113 RepID=UPI0035EBB270